MIFDLDGLMDTGSTNIASRGGDWAEWGLPLDRRTFFVPPAARAFDAESGLSSAEDCQLLEGIRP